MSQEDRISTWVADVDSEDETEKDRRSSWRFALHLWNVLDILKSPKAASLYQIFCERAKDEHFSRSLEAARTIHETFSLYDPDLNPEPKELTKREQLQLLWKLMNKNQDSQL